MRAGVLPKLYTHQTHWHLNCFRLFFNNFPATQTWIKHIKTLILAMNSIFLFHFMIRKYNTSVWSMAALCSLAVRDSLSTSMCCLQSEFWLLRVSSLVCKARSSDSFFESSCFSWSICSGGKKIGSLILSPIHSSIGNLKGVNDHDMTNQTPGRELRVRLFTLTPSIVFLAI